MSERLIRIRDVRDSLGISTTTVNRWVENGNLPPPVDISNSNPGKPVNRWIASEIEKKHPGFLTKETKNVKNKFLRIRELELVVGLSHSAIHNWIQSGKFPAPSDTHGNQNYWLREEIESWIQMRVQKFRSS